MKHRSIGVLIIAAAALAAAPQASQELSALKDSLAGRARAGILQALLNLQPRGAARQTVARAAKPAACEAEKSAVARKAEPADRQGRRDSSARQQAEQYEELAMIVDPNVLGVGPEKAESVVLASAEEPIDVSVRAHDLAMIIPPSEGNIQGVATASAPSTRVRRIPKNDVRSTFIAAGGDVEFEFTAEGVRRELEEALKEAEAARSAGEATRLLKVKRAVRNVAATPPVAAPSRPRRAPAPFWAAEDERDVIPSGE